jgi:ribose 5-phosphate isomerase A
LQELAGPGDHGIEPRLLLLVQNGAETVRRERGDLDVLEGRRRSLTSCAPMSTDAAREAAARAAVERVEPGMTLGLGSGRAVWRTIELIRERWPDGPPIQSAFASERTAELARAAGIEAVELDGELRLDLAIDGADEIDPSLGLIKGGGAALLREKIVVAAAERFVVVAEERKRVPRLGQTFRLPVEVVRFGWADTRRRVLELLPSAELRTDDDGAPVVTDEGHHLLDCELPPEGDVAELATALKGTIGVVEHGLFLGMADEALLGRPDGSLAVLALGGAAG